MKKILVFIITLSFISIFTLGCGGDTSSTGSASTGSISKDVSFPTTPPDCGTDCPPAFPSA
jgi:hypothetical protein